MLVLSISNPRVYILPKEVQEYVIFSLIDELFVYSKLYCG